MSSPDPNGFLDVEVEREKCCGYGNCVLAAPAVFDLDEHDGIVYTLEPRPPATLRPEVERAVADCPTEALRLRN